MSIGKNNYSLIIGGTGVGGAIGTECATNSNETLDDNSLFHKLLTFKPSSINKQKNSKKSLKTKTE